VGSTGLHETRQAMGMFLECKNAESLEVCCFGIYRTFRLDSLVPNTPRPGAANGHKGSEVKRKAAFETPGTSKISKGNSFISPGEPRMSHKGANEGLDSVQ